jgi:hypothetical protein
MTNIACKPLEARKELGTDSSSQPSEGTNHVLEKKSKPLDF